MKNKILFLIIVVLLIIYIGSLKSNKTIFFDEEKPKETIIRVFDKASNKKTYMNLEEYLVGVLAAEMPASFAEEALKAQAVAARTYAVYKINTSTADYDIVTDVSNQAFINEEAMQKKWGKDYLFYKEKITNAITATKDIVLTYNNEAICAFYFAISNGYTEDAQQVFGEKKEYIQSVESPWDKNVKNFLVTNNFSLDEFCQKLNIDCHDKNIVINNINKTSTERIDNITINNKYFKGIDIRKLLGLRSTDFEIKQTDNMIQIITKGYGHGVGMSQYGANEMAKKGKNYQEILKHYYKNIEFTKINV